MTPKHNSLPLQNYTTLVSEELAKYLSRSCVSPILTESMKYSLLGSGKMLRSSLCLATCELLHGDICAALPAACALEMIHTYSLIHDDLPSMDNDDMRRGKPSNHVAFGETNAILAGDGLQALAFYTASACENVEVMRLIADCAFSMVEGQSLDIAGASTADQLLLIHKNKTGALIRAAVLSGAIIANATTIELQNMEEFAEAYGVLFQITDDILDVEGSCDLLGKTIGKDSEQHKSTYVEYYGVDGAKKQAQRVADIALSALDGYGESAQYFVTLVHETLTRRK